MSAVLYFLSAAILLVTAHRYVTALTRRAALALLLLPLLFTARALFTNRIYAPVEMPYIAQPLRDHATRFHVGEPHNPILSDIAFQMIPWREATRRALASGEWPLINQFELCGDVLAAGAQPAVFSPFTLIACLLPAAISFTYTAAIAFFIAGLGAFLFARELDCSEAASLFAAAAWMFSGPVALQILWPYGFAWNLLPLVLAATHRIVRVPSQRSIAFLACALTLLLLAGHPETALHVVAIGVVYGAVTGPSLRGMGAAVIAGIIALGVSAIQLLPFLDALTQTREYLMRAIVYAHTPLRVPPNFTRDVLWGDPFPWLQTTSPRLPADIAAGSITVALAVYALVFVHDRRKWFFIALFGVALLVGADAWPFAQILHSIPLFDRALNERIATACPLAVAMLAAFAIDRLDRKRLAMCIAGLVAIDIGVALGFAATNVRFYADVIALGAAAVLCSRRLQPAVCLLPLLLAQRVIADGSLIPVNKRSIAYPHLALLAPIDKTFRVTGAGAALLPNTATMYGLQDVRGQTPMTCNAIADTFPLWSTIAAGQFHSTPDLTKPFLSALNVRYAITNVADPLPGGWREIARELDSRLIENTRVLPRAFIPRNVVLGSVDHELDEMATENDFANRAWLQTPDVEHERVNGGGTTSTKIRTNDLTIDVLKNGDGFVVISQTAWSGYRAYLDGQRVTLHRANHGLLAVFVPNGHHTIELRYWPESFVIGRAITLLTIVLYSTVTLLARLRGWSTSAPRRNAM